MAWVVSTMIPIDMARESSTLRRLALFPVVSIFYTLAYARRTIHAVSNSLRLFLCLGGGPFLCRQLLHSAHVAAKVGLSECSRGNQAAQLTRRTGTWSQRYANAVPSVSSCLDHPPLDCQRLLFVSMSVEPM